MADVAVGEIQYVVQLSWDGGAPHVWAVDPATGAVATTNELRVAVDRQLGRHVSAMAMPVRIPLERPGPNASSATPSLRVSAGALTDLSPSTTASPSVRWFRALTDLARATVRAQRVRATMTIEGPVHTVRWQPVIESGLQASIETLRKQQPPVCGVDDVEDLFAVVVDAVARRGLSEHGWRPPQPANGRGTEYRAAQAAFRALASASGTVLYRNDDLLALAALARILEHDRDRVLGMPVVAPQLRLRLPDGEDDDWLLTLELVDIDEPERWATAADIASATPLAVDLARASEHLPRLRDVVTEAARQTRGAPRPRAEPGGRLRSRSHGRRRHRSR